MRPRIVALACCIALFGAFSIPAAAQGTRQYGKEKNFDDLTPAEHSAAKAAALKRKLTALRVCADPGNMPLSNDRGEGFQNKILLALARAMDTRVSYAWRPYLERGLTRETFDNNECDVLVDMPTTLEPVLTTVPIYKSTYVLAYRNDKGIEIKSLDDSRLKGLRIGVFQHSGLREALVRRGIRNNLEIHVISHDADLKPEHQPWRQVQKVVDGELDAAGVWGPFAGWLVTMKGAPLVIQPVNLMDDEVELEFDLSLGMRKTDSVLKYMLDNGLERAKGEIEKILRAYGVPLVQCSRCVVQGDLPSHGSYYRQLRQISQDRFLKPAVAAKLSEKATPDQVVTPERVAAWLKDGANVDDELANAVLASDPERVSFLLERGADVNGRGPSGDAPLHGAARYRNSTMIDVLLARGADPNLRGADGMTPLLHAVMRNHVPSVEALAKRGADLELPTAAGITPLALAIEEGRYYAAKALIEAGAKVDTPSGPDGVTPLMVAATQVAAQQRAGYIVEGPAPIDIARELIGRGADVNATTKAGITALMVAAGRNNAAMIGLLLRSKADPAAKSAAGKTALDIARETLNDAAVRALELLVEQGRGGAQQ